MNNFALLFSFYLLSLFGSFNTCTGNQFKQSSLNSNCYTGRAVVDEISDVNMTCKMIAGTLMLQSSGTRYVPCNIDSLNLTEDKAYVISGKVYEIKPNERWAGTPFEITSFKN